MNFHFHSFFVHFNFSSVSFYQFSFHFHFPICQHNTLTSSLTLRAPPAKGKNRDANVSSAKNLGLWVPNVLTISTECGIWVWSCQKIFRLPRYKARRMRGRSYLGTRWSKFESLSISTNQIARNSLSNMILNQSNSMEFSGLTTIGHSVKWLLVQRCLSLLN